MKSKLKSPSLSRRLPKPPAAFVPSGGRSLVDWLEQGPNSAQVLTLARQLLALEQTVQPLLPPALRGVCRAVRLERRELTLAVSGAAQASRLRQMTPRILARLTHAGWRVDDIVIKIQAQAFAALASPLSDKPDKEAIALDARALQAFDALHGQLPDGVLADAVQRLLVHHGMRPR